MGNIFLIKRKPRNFKVDSTIHLSQCVSPIPIGIVQPCRNVARPHASVGAVHLPVKDDSRRCFRIYRKSMSKRKIML